MAIYDTLKGANQTDGRTYCSSVLLPAAEGDLYNQGTNNAKPEDPIIVLYHEAILAVVTMTAQGPISSDTAYVVMQTDLGDGNWVDVAWCTWTGTTGSAVFVLSGGVSGANSYQNSRPTGTAPTPLQGSNQIPLGGRIRFVGKASVTTGSSSSSARSSSSSSGTVTGILATILYKQLGLR